MQDSLIKHFGESIISFDKFVIKTPSGEVLKEGQITKLEPQVLSFLLLLIRHKERIVTRDEIVTEVWSGKKASDDAIRALVKKLRIALGDNARAPKFVKTVPLKGYMFIMPVQREFEHLDWWRSKYVAYGISALFLVLVTLFIRAQFTAPSSSTKSKQVVSVSKITDVKGSEVSPYLSKNNKLLFSHRSDNDQSLQLYVKDLNASSSKRLTWGSENFTNGIFSPDASQAIVRQQGNGQSSLLLFNFDQWFNITKVETIELDKVLVNQSVRAISYSMNGKSLYLFSENLLPTNAPLSVNTSLSNEPDLTDEAVSISDVKQRLANGLIRYNIETKRSTFVDFIWAAQSRVIDAIESDDGERLAVLIHIGNKAEIHVQDLQTKELILNKDVSDLPTSMVWDESGRSISFVTSTGELMNLSIPKQRIYQWTGLSFGVSEVVSQCGENCFVLKEQKDDLLNVLERPLPFNKQNYLSTLQFSLASTDRFPAYFNSGKGVFFLSLSDNHLRVNRYTSNGDVEAIYELPKTSNINTFVLSPDEKMFAGELDGRIFLYNLGADTLSFLSPSGIKSTNPVWSLLGDKVFYQQVINNESVIYAQDIVSNKITVKAEGLSLVLPVDASRWLLVDEKRQAFLYQSDLETIAAITGEEQNQKPSPTPSAVTVFSEKTLSKSFKFAELDSISSNGFDVQNNALFFISKSVSSSFLNKLDLETKIIEKVELETDAILHQLDIHPSMQKMLTVESSLSQSKLLKVDGLRLESRQINQVITETP